MMRPPLSAMDAVFLIVTLSALIASSSALCAQEAPVFYEENYATVDFASLGSGKQLSLCRVTEPFEGCTIEWTKDGAPLVTSPPHFMFTDNSQHLFIKDVVRSDAGNYSCSVTGPGGKISRNLTLRTYEDDNHPPFNLQWSTCKLDSTPPGGNVSASCLFDVGNDPGSVVCNWMKQNASAVPGSDEEWVPLFVAEIEWGIAYSDDLCEEDTTRQNLCGSDDFPRGTTQIFACLNLYNVTEEYYGKYMIVVHNGSPSNLTFELLDRETITQRTVDHTIVFIVVFSVVGAFLLSIILWQLVKTDVKLFVKDSLPPEKTENDGKLYDAYISYVWNETDTQFALSLKHHLERRGYKVYVPEVEISPGGCAVEEISQALEKSRRFVMILSDKYINGGLAAYEVNSFIDQVSRYRKRVISVVFGGSKVDTENCRTIMRHVLKMSRVVKWKDAIPIDESSIATNEEEDPEMARQDSVAQVVPAAERPPVSTVERSFETRVFKELLLGMPPKPRTRRGDIDNANDSIPMDNHVGNGFSNNV